MTHHPTPRQRSGAHPDDFKPAPLSPAERVLLCIVGVLALFAASAFAGYLWGRLA